jgi:hypothetical protein
MCAETNFSHPFLRKLQLHILNASTESEINTAFATLDQLRAGALLPESTLLPAA